MRFAIVGGVQSTTVALDSLLKHGADVVGVLAYVPKRLADVSGYVAVHHHAERAAIRNVLPFTRVNDQSSIDALRSWDIDVLIVVGLSQMVSSAVRDTARRLAVGFHPTKLPYGRGRAPIAWLVLKQAEGAATLFELSDSADEGDILVQVPYEVREDDHASDVVDRCMLALDVAVGELVSKLEAGNVHPQPQRHDLATYWGVRRPEDGRIDWNMTASEVDALVRASSDPHPGAYTVTPSGEKIAFMRSLGVLTEYTGIASRVLEIRGHSWLVACGSGAVRLGEIRRETGSSEIPMRVGERLSVTQHDIDRIFLGKPGHHPPGDIRGSTNEQGIPPPLRQP